MCIKPDEIQVSHRLGKFKGKDKRPRPLITRFASAKVARNVLHASRENYKKTKQSARQDQARLGATQTNIQTVRAREHLTDLRAQILQECIKLREKKAIYSCWTFNWNIFVRNYSKTRSLLKLRV